MVPGGSLDSADSHRSYFSSIHPSPLLGKTQHIVVYICTYDYVHCWTHTCTHAHIHICKVCSIKTSVVVYGGLREGGGESQSSVRCLPCGQRVECPRVPVGKLSAASRGKLCYCLLTRSRRQAGRQAGSSAGRPPSCMAQSRAHTHTYVHICGEDFEVSDNNTT